MSRFTLDPREHDQQNSLRETNRADTIKPAFPASDLCVRSRSLLSISPAVVVHLAFPQCRHPSSIRVKARPGMPFER